MERRLTDDVLRAAARSYVVVVLLAVVVAAAVAPIAWDRLGPAEPAPEGAVAIVTIDGTITSSRAEDVAWDLREARQRDDVKAVVLQVDSPGGSAAASEHLYIAVRRTAAELPVVATVDATAASGAYYAIVPADTIFVTPASIVGSVGVRASYPSGGFGDEITTGPDKLSGGTTAEARARVETIRRAFLRAVVIHRGDRLALAPEEVANAKVYAGARAVDNGLADRIGVLDDGIAEAAALAGLDRYSVVHTRLGSGQRLSTVYDGIRDPPPRLDRRPFDYEGVETTTYLMLWGQVERRSPAGTDADGPTATPTPTPAASTTTPGSVDAGAPTGEDTEPAATPTHERIVGPTRVGATNHAEVSPDGRP